MVLLNLQTVDELIFSDPKVRELLRSSFRPIIDQWFISQRMPFMRHLRKQARLDMINGLKQEHIQVLEKHFGTRVIVERFDSHVVKNLEFGVNDEIDWCQLEGFSNFAVSRSPDTLYITAWR
jgi:hypothetical protein